MDAPSIAKDYWRLPENATMKDVLYAVRSDETTHRFVNHSLGNLGPNDVNPFAIREPDMHVKGKTIEYVSCLSVEWCMSLTSNRFSRKTATKYVTDNEKLIKDHSSPNA
jgi:Alternative oxidase